VLFTIQNVHSYRKGSQQILTLLVEPKPQTGKQQLELGHPSPKLIPDDVTFRSNSKIDSCFFRRKSSNEALTLNILHRFQILHSSVIIIYWRERS
jgi:hypothetical protein